jgi:hypothetical protein
VDAHRGAGAFDALDTMAEDDGDPFREKRALQDGAHVGLLKRQQVFVRLDDRDLRPEAEVGLPQLAGDVSPADHDEVLGRLVQPHQALVGQERHLVESRNGGHERAHPGRDHDRGRDEVQRLRALRGAERLVPVLGDGAVLVFDDGSQVHPRPGRVDVEAPGRPHGVGHAGAVYEELARHAARVQAGASERRAVDEGHAPAGLDGEAGDDGAGLSGSQDDRVERLGHWPCIRGAPPRPCRKNGAGQP